MSWEAWTVTYVGGAQMTVYGDDEGEALEAAEDLWPERTVKAIEPAPQGDA